MFTVRKGVLSALAIATLLMASAAVSLAQTTGSVTMNATVSNFVELTSGGAVTLTGNSGGSVITDGTANSPLAVVVNLGEGEFVANFLGAGLLPGLQDQRKAFYLAEGRRRGRLAGRSFGLFQIERDIVGLFGLLTNL